MRLRHLLARCWPARVVWPAGLRRFSIAHGLAGAADAFVAVSLAGSLFFNLSPDASREQVLLYLAINLAPFAILAPLIGPTIDRFTASHRVIAAVLFTFRAVCAAALAANLLTLTLYPFALALLVGAKASGVTRQALVPSLVAGPDQLVAANSRLARLTTIAGAVGGLAGAAAMALSGPGVTLVLACATFAGAAAVMFTVPARPPGTVVDAPIVRTERHPRTVVATQWAFALVRGAVGFFGFGLAFALRRASEPAWIYGAALAAYGIGTFAGHAFAPRLRRRYDEALLTLGSLGAVAVVAGFGALGSTRALVLLVAVVLGAAAAVGRQGFDAMVQSHEPASAFGRTFAGSETWFQLAWVGGALIATASSLNIRLAMAALAVALIPAAWLYERAIRVAARETTAATNAPTEPLVAARNRVRLAVHWLALGQPGPAVVELQGAIDLARLAGRDPDPAVAARVERLRQAALTRQPFEVGALAGLIAEVTTLSAPRPDEATPTHPPSGTTVEPVTDQPDEPLANVRSTTDQLRSER